MESHTVWLFCERIEWIGNCMINESRPQKMYGRERELDELVRAITLRTRPTIALYGRRRIGKTELVRQAINHIRTMPDNEAKPMVYLEVQPNPTRIGEELEQAIHEAGLAGLMADMERTQGWDPNDTERLFYDQARHLVKKGGIICLDEFHNIDVEGGQLIYYVKLIIEDVKSKADNPHPSGGGFVVSGSHQQNMIRLLGDPREPLYDRFTKGIHLRQLRAPPLLQMASDNGWLHDPRQFLTLYSAYGGVPGLWVKYQEAEEDNPELKIQDYDSWRSRFLRYESLRPLKDEREGYGYKGYVELEKNAERVLMLMSRKPKGIPRTEIFNLARPANFSNDNEFAKALWSETMERTLKVLESHLQFIKGIKLFDGGELAPQNYHIVDNDTRHQLLVKRLELTAEDIDRIPLGGLAERLKETEQYEGLDLERLASEYLGDLCPNGISNYHVQPPGDGPDLDVLVKILHERKKRDVSVIMGSCKRSSKRHVKDSKSPKTEFEPFLKRIYDDLGQTRPSSFHYVLIAPEFTPEQHARLKKRGFVTMDLPSMAKSLSLDPIPVTNNPVPGINNMKEEAKPDSGKKTENRTSHRPGF